MPYQVLHQYDLLHVNNFYSINVFMCLMVTTTSPSVSTFSRFSMLVFFLFIHHAFFYNCIQAYHWRPYKKNPSIGLHGSSTALTANSIGILFIYMVHQYWSQHYEIKPSHIPLAIKDSTSSIHIKLAYKYTFHPCTYSNGSFHNFIPHPLFA